VARSRPRHQYDPSIVAVRVLSDERLFRVCELVFSSDQIVHSVDIERHLGVRQNYAYKLLRRLEKWGVVKGVRDPVNGKLGFRPAKSRVAELVAEEVRKRRASEVEEVLEGALEGEGEEEQ